VELAVRRITLFLWSELLNVGVDCLHNVLLHRGGVHLTAIFEESFTSPGFLHNSLVRKENDVKEFRIHGIMFTFRN
jgi:hypothetical protein